MTDETIKQNLTEALDVLKDWEQIFFPVTAFFYGFGY